MTPSDARAVLLRRAHELVDEHFAAFEAEYRAGFNNKDAIDRYMGASRAISLFSQIAASALVNGESVAAELRYFVRYVQDSKMRELGSKACSKHLRAALDEIEPSSI